MVEVARSGQGAPGEELQVRAEGGGEVRRDGEGVVRGVDRGDDRAGRHAGAGHEQARDKAEADDGLAAGEGDRGLTGSTGRSGRGGGRDAAAGKNDVTAPDVEPLAAGQTEGLRTGEAQRALTQLDDRVEGSRAGTRGDRTVEHDRSAEFGVEAEGAGRGDIGDTTGDAQGAAGASPEGRLEGVSDRTRVGVVAAEARKLARGIDAAVKEVVAALERNRVADRDPVEQLDARSAPVIRRSGDRSAAGRVVMAEAQDTAGDGDRTGPAGIVRGEGEDACIALAERAVGVTGEIERRGEGQDLVADDFKRVISLIEEEGTAGREGIRGAETDAEEPVGIERDAVAGGAQGGVGVGGEHAAQDVDGLPCPAERIDAAEFEGARAGLDQAEVGDAVVDDAGQDEAGVLEPVGSRSDREVGRAAHGGRAGHLEAVAREVRHAHDVAGDVQRALLDDLVARERTAAGTIDGDRGVAGDRDVAADRELLIGAAAIAVGGDGKTTGDEDVAGVVADIDRAETRLVDDVGTDRRRGVGQVDREQRIQDVDVPDGRQGRDAVDGERGGRVRGRREERVTLEGDGVADRPRARGEEAGVGRHGEAGRAEGTGRDRAAERIAVAPDGETAGGDVDAAREGAGAGKLEHAVAGLDDTAVLDDRDDVQRRLQRGERDAVGDMRTDGEGGRRLGGEIEGAVGERRNSARIDAGDGQPARKRGGTGQVERRASAVVADGDRGESVGLVGQIERRTAADREGLGRDDAAESLREDTFDQFQSAGAEDARGAEDAGAAVDDGPTGVGVGGIKGDDRGAGLLVAGRQDEADRSGHGVVHDRGVHEHGTIVRAEVIMEEVEVGRRTHGARGDRAVLELDKGVAVVRRDHQAAAGETQAEAGEIEGVRGAVVAVLEIQRVDDDVLDESRDSRTAELHADIVRGRGTRQQAFAGVTADARLAEAGQAGHRIVGSPIAIDDRPRADDAVGQGDAAVDLEAYVIKLAETAEVIEAQGRRRTRGAGQAAKEHVGRADAPAAGIDADLIDAFDERDRAEALRDVGGHASIEQDFRGP